MVLKPTIYNKIKFGLGKAKISRAFIRLIISENSSSEICTKIDNFFLHQNGVEFGLVSIGRGGKSGGAYISIAPRRKWTGPFLAEEFGPNLPHFLRFISKGLFIALLQLDQ